MPKKLYSWVERLTTLTTDGQVYDGKVVTRPNLHDSSNQYYFQTTQGELLPISSHGPRRVICLNGGLSGLLRLSQ